MKILSRILLYSSLGFIGYIASSYYSSNSTDYTTQSIHDESLINISGETLAERIRCPKGFKRQSNISEYAKFLVSIELKENGSPVLLYNGEKKSSSAHVAVLDYDVGKKDLQQCADAVMRIRAEYLYAEAQYENIHFNFTNGFKAEYSRWRAGERISVKGNHAKWVNSASPSTAYSTFRKYLDMVYMYAGTLSLELELKSVNFLDMKIGDVLIQGGSPGHAVLIMDMCENEFGEKLYLLSQSYMPAQDIHILKNLNDASISPWYKLDETIEILTPDWVFQPENLRRFSF